MQIIRADAMGMCFGVRDALAVIEEVPRPEAVTIHGELVHNGEVLRMLAARGFPQSGEASRGLPPTDQVLITAHGVSNRERRRLRAAGKQLLDTTCPLVHKAHEAAQLLQADGRRVVVIGKPDHVEVRGIVEDLKDAVVVQSAGDVRVLPERRLGVVCQTTTPSERVDRMMAAIRRVNAHADVRLIDTVCNPTKARVAALESLLPQIDALVVVGGRDSNNTRQLVVRGERCGLATLHVENAGELVAGWFEGRERIGLTAGTSTLPATIEAVDTKLRGFAAVQKPSPASR
jgi:4-hydroxy-3-methylbut-2-en-1-yl diphosphate reductase